MGSLSLSGGAAELASRSDAHFDLLPSPQVHFKKTEADDVRDSAACLRTTGYSARVYRLMSNSNVFG
jgi:hypothetical protein